MKLKFTAPLDWPHEGGLLHFDKDQEIDTDDPLLIDVCTKEGWAIKPPDKKPPLLAQDTTSRL